MKDIKFRVNFAHLPKTKCDSVTRVKKNNCLYCTVPCCFKWNLPKSNPSFGRTCVMGSTPPSRFQRCGCLGPREMR